MGARLSTRTKPGYWQSSEAALSVHTGCHVESRLHTDEQGEAIDAVPLERVIGSAVVLDLTPVGERDLLGPADLERAEESLHAAGERSAPGT